MTSLKFDLFDCKDNYLCKINVPEELSSASKCDITTIVILDKSGSMSGAINKITYSFLPELFIKLNYKNNQPITFITFSYNSQITTYEVSDLVKGISISANGQTYMKPALQNLNTYLKETNKNKHIRILTISDGQLFDQDETAKYSSEVLKVIEEKQLLVNSQAIRFFTSQSQPDTRGLSSCLQFANVCDPKLIDIQTSNYSYENYEYMFHSDGLEGGLTLKTQDESFKKEIYCDYSKEIIVGKGENIFWIKKEVGDELLKGNNVIQIDEKNNEKKIKIEAELKENITINNYQKLISQKINFYMKKLKLLKIVNSQDSLNEMDKIIEFFKNFEYKIFFSEEMKKMDNSLKSRLITISKKIEKQKILISNKMAEIRNDEKVSLLNSQQQADYLRKIDVNSKTSKALAKRALTSGIEFDQIARDEVIEISKHIQELENIDESKLNVSFYSTCNTLEGIRTVSQLPSNKDIFKEITANDIIKLLNIVGIAAYSPVGDYPDPMTYRLEKLYPSTFISISDILTAYEVSGGYNLTEIGEKKNLISTCIPFFEDEKIHQFLVKYAPHLLEYTASVGMRKIISEIPYTYEYTILAGYWKMLDMILKDRSEVNIKTFINFIQNYKISSKNHFEYVIELVENQKKLPKTIDSIYIANNGITNMTFPLIELVLNQKNEIDHEFIQKIIRATYQFEVYQYIRKLIRKQNPDTTNDFIKNSLIELLNIDIEKNKTKLNPNFETDDDLPIYEDYVPNIEVSKNKYLKHIFWLDNIVAVPVLLKAALDKDNPVEKIKNIPSELLTDEFIKKELGIEYDLNLFRFNCIIQCFLYKEKVDRCDSEKKKMLISDLFYDKHFDKIIKKYVKSVFQSEFQKDKMAKIKTEIDILKTEIVKLLLESDEKKKFIEILNKGIKKGPVELIILNPNSIGYYDLINALLNENNKNIPLRQEKLFIVLTGRDCQNTSEILWNQGNILRDKKILEKATKFFDEDLKAKFYEAKKTGIHIYRAGIYIYRGGKDKCNRHGHSNDLPSYWAYGYESVENMAKHENNEFMDNYYATHIGCCGLGEKSNLSYKKMKKKGKKEGSIGGASYSSKNDDEKNN